VAGKVTADLCERK